MTVESVLAPVLQMVAMETELPMPPWSFGLLAFVSLLVMMGVVLSVGKGRPHS